MQILLLIVIEIAIGIAIGITEFHDVATTSHIGEGDDNHMLHISIYHRVVDNATHAIENRNIHVAEALVESDVDSIVAGSCFYGIGTN